MFEIFFSRLRQARKSEEFAEKIEQVNQANRDALGVALRVTALEDAVKRLTAINRALWEIARERWDLTNEELMDKVNGIQYRESLPDDSRGLRHCRKCGRMADFNHPRCVYCGGPVAGVDVFDTVI